jgi:hypothetical protein
MYKLAVVLVLVVGCTKKADQCTSNADCTDPAYPFCDVNGEFAPSGSAKNVCTIVPPDCPVSQCGCEPGAVTCGSDNMLDTCNSDGMSVTSTACGLGCEASGTACKTIEPSNGLGPALMQASTEPAVTLGSGDTIDTDAGTVTDASGNVIAVPSTLIPQTNAAPIRAFIAHSFTIGSVTVTGSNALALVSDGPIAIEGLMNVVASVSASGQSQGVGAQPMSAPCTGESTFDQGCVTGTTDDECGYAGGGGGNDMPGAAAGGIMIPENNGGVAVTGFSLLVGGCAGGSPGTRDNPPGLAGAGGGAVQIVSATSVTLDGVINVGGGGGTFSSGGGSGGMVVIEAPIVIVHDGGGIAANGGGGGGCDTAGATATPDTTPAGVGSCKAMTTGYGTGGTGGTLLTAPGVGVIQTDGIITGSTPNAGGGGGSVGRARIATLDGTVSLTSGAIMSAAVTNDMLDVQ